MMGSERPTPDCRWEKSAGHPQQVIVGVDEVGRGCLAGPVVASAVVLPERVDRRKEPWLKDVTDSKLLSPELRKELAPRIQGWVRAHSVAHATVEEIDRLNIYHASHLAMVRAIEALPVVADHVLVDGNAIPKAIRCKVTPIVKGDQLSLSIACASILAKVWRDNLMASLEEQYPGYGFSEHKGYSTPSHKKALEKLGACVLHRRSFAPVAAVIHEPGWELASGPQTSFEF